MKDDRNLSDVELRVPETSSSRMNELKKERVPIYKQAAMTYTKKEPGWHYHFVSDAPGRIQKFIQAGYEIVQGDIEDTYSGKGRKEVSKQGSYIRRISDPNHKEYQESVLMRIPLEMWTEDLQAKERRLDETEADFDPDGRIKKARQLAPRANLHIK